MSSLTLAISNDLRVKMKKFPEINWSEVARQAIVEKTQTLEKMQQLMAKSQISKVEAINLGREIKQAVSKRHKRQT